ncbi:Nickel transport complex, NikM subunit, transmembrane [Pseudodesulfovibrio mercurii]|uniref:Nickel transport complex, NikM subunit, transmembrane n=1 Tax=Pseudodesulfovibrio mercurii TaxID=641491 RepID=F0JGH8_9BACT|nr:DUF4198 domain-containing protein [Pseudodesulfovibrio mercurii]EGB15095.1 Nickel transport complex, NikM subunit, transmembrane [Pseudodesulfovibrio mercurii]
MSRRIALLCAALCLVAVTAISASAHEFILVPQSWKTYSPGQEVPFSLVSAHVFMKSEELENPANVKASYLGKDIPLAVDQAFKSFTGTVTLGQPGAALLHGHRLGEVWSKTPKGVLKGDRSTLKGVVWSRNYEKFCKTLIPVGGRTQGWDVKTGDALEIVPLNNPLELKVGDTLTVQILLDGKPVSPDAVTATYAGFTDTPNAYAYFTEPYGEGKADITISAPGFWMVRVQYVVDEKGANYEQHAMRSVLAFPVK